MNKLEEMFGDAFKFYNLKDRRTIIIEEGELFRNEKCWEIKDNKEFNIAYALDNNNKIYKCYFEALPFFNYEDLDTCYKIEEIQKDEIDYNFTYTVEEINKEIQDNILVDGLNTLNKLMLNNYRFKPVKPVVGTNNIIEFKRIFDNKKALVYLRYIDNCVEIEKVTEAI